MTSLKLKAAGNRRRTALLAVVGAVVVSGGGGLAPSALAGPRRAADLVRIAHFAQDEGALLGVVLPGGSDHFIRLIESPLNEISTPTGPADATTNCVDANGAQQGSAVRCTIEIATHAHSDARGIGPVVAHEVFHAFQAVMSGNLANADRPGTDWLAEGSAAWVASDLVSDDPYDKGSWADYFTAPGVPLFSRSYDAIGFFGHLASSGVDLWKRFPAIFATTSNTAAYSTATLGTSDARLQNEASVFFREPAFGPAWDQEDQQHARFANENVPSAGDVRRAESKPFTPEKITITAASPSLTVTVPAYADKPVELDVHLKAAHPFLNVTVLSGHARIHSAEGDGNVDAVDPVGKSFCADRRGCSCPGNPEKGSETFLRGDLAITGGPTGGAVKLSSGPCGLQPRSCIDLLPTTDFMQVPIPTYDGMDVAGITEGPLSEVLAPYPGECLVEYTATGNIPGLAPMSNTVQVGIYSLVTFSTDTDARRAFERFVSGRGEQPVAGIGDEASVGPDQGALLVRNDVFDVSWVAAPMPPGVSVQGVLQNVVTTLAP